MTFSPVHLCHLLLCQHCTCVHFRRTVFSHLSSHRVTPIRLRTQPTRSSRDRRGGDEFGPARTSLTDRHDDECVFNVPVPQILADTDKVTSVVSQERVQQQTDEHKFDVPMLRILKDTVDLTSVVSQERVQLETDEHKFDVPMLRMLKDTVDLTSVVSQERVQLETDEHTFDVPALPILKRHCRGDEFGQQRTAEQIEDVQNFQEETVEMVRLDPHERVQQPTSE